MVKKVIVVSSEFPPHPGGIGNHAYHLAKYLSREGKEVTVVAPRDQWINADTEFDKLQSFHVIRIGGVLPIRFFRILSVLRKEATPDSIILASGRTSLIIVGVASLVLRDDVVIAGMAHGLDIHSSQAVVRAFVNFALSRMVRIIAVSNYTASKLKPAFLRKTKVINNGFEGTFAPDGALTPLLKERGRGEGPAFVTVGSVSQRKGQLNFIRALPELKKKFPNVRYSMVGFPAIADRVREEANALGVLENITIHGVLEDQAMKAVLAGADIFVMLSDKTSDGDFEGFGIAIIEANAMGLPGIGSRDCGIEDAIVNNRSGILVDPHDPAGIARAAEAMVNDYPAYRANAMEHARLFHWNRVIQKYIPELDELTLQK